MALLCGFTLVLLPSHLAGQEAPLSSDQIKQMIRVAAEKDEENDKRQRDYTYIQREEEHHLNGKGQTKSTAARTYEILVLYDEPVQKLIAKNDKPLPEKDAAKEDAKIQKIVDDRKNESDEQRKKRLAKQEKERE